MAGSNPFYNLVGGYYPGDPIPRKYSGGRPPEPTQMNTDGAVDEYLDAVKKDLERYTIGGQAKNIFVRDVENAFRVTAQPKGNTYDAMRSLELGDEEDVAGVQLKVDLNPVKWIQDPGEMARKTGQGVLNDFFNWQDAITHSEAELWNPLLRGELDTKTENLGPGAESAFGEHLDPSVTNTAKPFQLIGLEGPGVKMQEAKGLKDATGLKTGNVDKFAETAKGFKNFARATKSRGSRDSSFRALGKDASQAAAFELKNLVLSGDISDPAQVQEVESFLHKAKALRLANNMVSNDFKKYLFSDDVIDPDTGVHTDGYGFGARIGFKTLSGDFGKFAMGNLREAKAIEPGGTSGDDPVEFLNGQISGVMKTAGAISKHLENSDAYFDNLGGNHLAEFKKDTKPLRDLLNKVRVFENAKIDKNQPKLAQKAKAINLKGQLDEMLEVYARDGAIKGGLDRMNRKFIETHLVNNEALRKVIYENDSVVGTKNLLDVMDTALSKYRHDDFFDLVDTLENGGPGIFPDYGYTRLRKRLAVITPAAVIKENLSRTHYFGMSYQSDYGTGGPNDNARILGVPVTAASNWVIDKSPIKGLFDNVQTLELDIKGVKQNLKFVGDGSLALGFELYERTVPGAVSKDMALSLDGFIALLNGKPGPGMRYDINPFAWGMATEAQVVVTSKHLRAWLKKHAGHLLEFDDEGLLITVGQLGTENKEALRELFAKLQDRQNSYDHIAVTAKKAGVLDKLSAKLNQAQTAVFNFLYHKMGLKKVLAPLATLQEIYSKNLTKKAIGKKITKAIMRTVRRSALGKAIAKALTALFAAGTDGLATVVWPLIERAIEWVVNKALDFARNFLKSIREGGFYLIEKFVDGAAQGAMKTASYAYLIFVLLVGAPFLAFMLVLSSITPIDPTRVAQVDVAERNPGPPVICPEDICEPVATVGCFEFLPGWPSEAQRIIENAADHLVNTHGRYVDKLCEPGDIKVAWNAGGTLCGEAPPGTSNLIYFGNGGCWPYTDTYQDSFTFLFAHESGHVYDRRHGRAGITQAQTIDGGKKLPTYVGGSTDSQGNSIECTSSHNSDSEDFAETIGQTVVFSGECLTYYDGFWDDYRGHYELAKSLGISLR